MTSPEKKKMGRPLVDEPKNHQIGIRLNEREFIDFKNECDKLNTTPTKYLRECIEKVIKK